VTAAAESALGRAVEGAAGAGTDLDVAGEPEGAVWVRCDLEPTVARLERFRFLGRRLAGGCEAGLLVGAVAERLFLGIAAAAESGPSAM